MSPSVEQSWAAVSSPLARGHGAGVAQVSKPAVSRVSKPAGCLNVESCRIIAWPADLEVGDTAGLETCATPWRECQRTFSTIGTAMKASASRKSGQLKAEGS